MHHRALLQLFCCSLLTYFYVLFIGVLLHVCVEPSLCGVLGGQKKVLGLLSLLFIFLSE